MSLGVMQPIMEGTLWKWTNYFSGWQPRWFVLDNGILSYYRSEDDVNNGCKGSVKMSVCDVTVHSTDSTRLDLTIPGEAHFYVKAATPQERQQWLVALGSCKACLSNGKPQSSSDEIPGEELKSKKSELRLYCDLLMQQVHSVKSSVQSTQTPDLEKLNEATSLLSATCDTFIQTLEDCMALSQSSVNKPGDTSNGVSSPTRKSSTSSSKSVPWGNVSRSTSVDSYMTKYSHRRSSQPSSPWTDKVIGYISANRPVRSRTTSESSQTSTRSSHHTERHNQGKIPENDSNVSLGSREFNTSLSDAEENLDEANKLPTFVSTMSASFMDIKLQEDGGIPTLSFLDACRAILPIFDKLNHTAFAPVKLDVAGNIRKIQQKFTSNPNQFATLQNMVLHEVQAKQSHLSNSATTAILWLKRTLEFTREFIREYQSGTDDITLVVNTAYVKTLKDFHGWVVRGVFAVAVKSLPTSRQLLEVLSCDPSHLDSPYFIPSIMKDLEAYVTALDVITQILHDFYTEHDLDSKEQV